MAVVVLAMFAVLVGFILIALMGKEPVPVLRDESPAAAEAAGRLAFFEDMEEFEKAIEALLNAQGLKVTDVRGVSEEEFEVFAQAGQGFGAGTVVLHCVFGDAPVPAERVSNLLSAVRGERAMKGIFITSSYFTADVHTIAEGPAMELVNIERLTELLDTHGVPYRCWDEVA